MKKKKTRITVPRIPKKLNSRRFELIDKKTSDTISSAEEEELIGLQQEVDRIMASADKERIKYATELLKKLKKLGKKIR